MDEKISSSASVAPDHNTKSEENLKEPQILPQNSEIHRFKSLIFSNHLSRNRDGQRREADAADHGSEIHVEEPPAAGAEVREGGEGGETEGEEGDREGQHGRRPDLRRELHPQAQRADELPPPLLPPRRRRRAPRHAGEDDLDQQVHGQHRQIARVHARHRQPAEDVRDDGPVRAPVRQHGGAGRVHGELHGRQHLALDSRGRGQQPHAAGRRRLRPRGVGRPPAGRGARRRREEQREGRRGRSHQAPRRAQGAWLGFSAGLMILRA